MAAGCARNQDVTGGIKGDLGWLAEPSGSRRDRDPELLGETSEGLVPAHSPLAASG